MKPKNDMVVLEGLDIILEGAILELFQYHNQNNNFQFD